MGISSSHSIQYLGATLSISNRYCFNLWQKPFQRMSTKNYHWSSKSLSHAGRKTLIQSVTSAIPTYWFATQHTSQKIFHHIDSLNSRFLWKGNNDGHRHLIPISCSRCAKNICSGGLGLCNAFLQAQSSLLYLAWLFLRYPHQLWATYLIQKYLRNTSFRLYFQVN